MAAQARGRSRQWGVASSGSQALRRTPMRPKRRSTDIPSAGCSENQELDQLDRELGGAEVTAVSARRADMGNIFAAHFRYERANAAARRFISNSTAVPI